MTDSATTPSLDDYFDAAFQASLDGTINSGITPLLGKDGNPVKKTITGDGFSAMAFVTPENQIIVAYCGTDFKQISTRPVFLAHQIIADYDIYKGENPKAYSDGLGFLKRAENAASADGYSTESGNVFVAGHSLGGAIAAFVSAQDNLPGTTFAAPGLAPGDIPTDATADPTAYVEYGDPIGNYGNNPNYEGKFLDDDGISRFGTTSYVGNPLDRLEIQAAGKLYGGGTIEKGLGLFGFAAAAIAHHPLTDYATDLGVASPPQASGPEITSKQLVQEVEQVLASAGAAGATGLQGTQGGDTPPPGLLTPQRPTTFSKIIAKPRPTSCLTLASASTWSTASGSAAQTMTFSTCRPPTSPAWPMCCTTRAI